jgi:hypothetical protein
VSLRSAFGAVALCALGMSPAYAERFLCVAEHAAGVVYDEVRKQWQPAVGRTDRKYIIAEPDESINLLYEFVVTEVGDSYFSYYCIDGFDQSGLIRCSSSYGYLMMNKNTGRFQSHYDYGYMEGPERDSTDNTPFVQIGTCSPF